MPGTIGTSLDPVNLAAVAMPIITEAQMGGMLARMVLRAAMADILARRLRAAPAATTIAPA